MCHPVGFPLPRLLEGLSAGSRRYSLRPTALVVGATINPPQTTTPRAHEGEGEGEGDGDGGGRKMCLCSPTMHPGSFRCRYHHANYVWYKVKTESQSPR